MLRADIDEVPEDRYSSQMRRPIDIAVAEDDVLLAEFEIRSIEATGEVTAVFEEDGGNYAKSLAQGIVVRPSWEKVQLPFVATASHGAGQAIFGFQFGQQLQTVEFRNIRVLNYGPGPAVVEPNSLWLNEINGEWATDQTVAVNGQAFSTAYEINVHTTPPESWQIQAVQRTAEPVAVGEQTQIRFFARATSGSGEGYLTIRRTDNFSQLLGQPVSLTDEWELFTVDYTADTNYAADDLQFTIDFGADKQTIQIAEFTWKNLNRAFDVTELPKMIPAAEYAGRGAEESWRDAADDRIRSHRTRPLQINVVDVNGQPVDAAVVSVKQQRHDFRFGSAIDAYEGRLDPNGTQEALTYQSEVLRLFNTVVAENALKWPRFDDDAQPGIDAVNFADANDLYFRGHNIIWPSREYMPEWIWNEFDSLVDSHGQPAANEWLGDQIEARIADVTTTFAGLIDEWDVVNEPFSNREVMDELGDAILLDWYQKVRDADPSIELALNDYDIFANNGTNAEHRTDFDNWLTQLNAADLVDRIGEQGHYNEANLTDIETLGQLIDKLSLTVRPADRSDGIRRSFVG